MDKYFLLLNRIKIDPEANSFSYSHLIILLLATILSFERSVELCNLKVENLEFKELLPTFLLLFVCFFSQPSRLDQEDIFLQISLQ